MATATAARPDAQSPAKDTKKKKEKKSRKKLIILIVAVLLVAGGAYKFVLAPKGKPAPPTGGDVVAMDATTLNLANGHYLKMALAVQLIKGKASAGNFDTSHAAELVINEFSNRSVASLSTNAERQRLTDDLEAQIKKAYPDEVYTIFITQFVTQ